MANWYDCFPSALTPIPESPPSRFNDHDSIVRLETERDRLFGKLESGYTRIESEIASPTIALSELWEWERMWKRLLRDYERVCDELHRVI